MGNQATQDEVKPKESQPATPEATPAPQPDPAVIELQRKMEALEKQIADKDRYITDVINEKATLEQRLQHTQAKPQGQAEVQNDVAKILETAQIDPAKAGEDLAQVLKSTQDATERRVLQNLGPIIEQQTYINEIKTKNADLVDLGLEPTITLRAQQLMNTGKSFRDAVNVAVTEARSKVDKLKSNAPPQPTPPAAVVESGGNAAPAPTPPPKVETQEDEMASRAAKRAKMGL